MEIVTAQRQASRSKKIGLKLRFPRLIFLFPAGYLLFRLNINDKAKNSNSDQNTCQNDKLFLCEEKKNNKVVNKKVYNVI